MTARPTTGGAIEGGVIDAPAGDVAAGDTGAADQAPDAGMIVSDRPMRRDFSMAIGFLFYDGTQFPAAYRGDAFVAFRGSWNRSMPAGYEVVRVHFANGMPAPLPGGIQPWEDFLTGFLVEGGAAHFGRIAGLAVDATGALIIAEDTNGMVYRVSYGNAADGGAPDAPAADAGLDAVADAPAGN